MATSSVIFGLLVVGVAAAIATLFRPSARRHTDHHAQAPGRVNGKSDGRASDDRVLSPAAKKAVKRAKALMAQGEHRQASLLLEHIGLHREAISMLENAGLIDEAAGVLMKMRRPNRAGVVYARHGRWDAAVECFKAANLPFEAAKCLREVNRHAEAAELFIEAGRQDEAAVSFMMVKNYQGAGKLFLKLGQREKALRAYEEFAAKGDHGASAKFDDVELDLIQEAVEHGTEEAHFTDILNRHGRMLKVIKAVIEAGKLAEATRFYQNSKTDLGPLLMSEVNLQSKDATLLATIFKQSGQPRYAGMVLEQVGDYSGAAECFEASGEFERASYCWDRAGNRDRAKQATAKKLSPSRDIATFTGSENETTEVMDKKSSPSPKPAPVSEAMPKPTVPLAAGVFSIDNVSVFSPDALTAHMDVDRGVFERCSLFADLDHKQIQKIWTITKVESVPAGTSLCPADGKPTGIYLIADGVVACDGAPLLTPPPPKSELQPGDYFGHISTLAGGSESSIYSSKSPCRLLFLEHTKLIAIFESDGQIAHKVYKTFTAQLISGNSNPLKPRLNLRAS